MTALVLRPRTRTWLGASFIAVMIVGLTMTIVVLAWQSESTSAIKGTSGGPLDPGSDPGTRLEQSGVSLPEGVSVEVAPGAASSAPMVLIVTPVDDLRSSPAIKIYDSLTGLERASIDAGNSPVALARSAEGSIVVSDRQADGSFGRVFTLDVSTGFSASSIVGVPSRVGYSSYQPAMVLSSDEKFLAVRQVLNREEIDACQGGGVDLICDDNRFLFVDLDTMSITGEITLEQGCGGHSAVPSQGGFVVVCANSGYVAEVSPRGDILRETDFSALPGMQLNPVRRNPAWLTFAAAIDGQFVVYRTDGLMIAEDGTSARVIPEGEFIDEWFSLPGDLLVARLRIPTRAYVVFDMRTFEVLGLHEVPGLTSIAPAGGDQIWTLSDGVVQLRNVMTGAISEDVQIEVGENAYLLP